LIFKPGVWADLSRNRCHASLFSSERHSVEWLQPVCRSRWNRDGPDIELGREILGGIGPLRHLDGANQEVPGSGWHALAEGENAKVIVRKQRVLSTWISFAITTSTASVKMQQTLPQSV
jgi:hypothetical protein